MSNNLLTGLQAVTPLVDITFADAGFTAQNLNVAFGFQPNSSFKFGRDFNTLASLQAGKGVLLDMKGPLDATEYFYPGVTSITPAAPSLTADDTANTITASHALGAAEIEYSENDGSFQQYTAAINVGDAARSAGYLKFRTKAAAGRNVSPTASSPQFNAVGNPLHYSTFTAPDNTILTDYLPEVGAKFTLGAGSFKIVGNKAQTDGAAGSPDNNYYAKFQQAVSNHFKWAVQAETNGNGRYRQLFVKMNAGFTDGIVLNISETGTDLIELIAGTPSVTPLIGPSLAENGLTEATFEIEVDGTALTFKRNGVLWGKSSDASTSIAIAAHAGNYFGLGNANTGTPVAGSVKFSSERLENI